MRIFIALMALVLGMGTAQAQVFGLKEAKPETVGFDAERLKRLDAELRRIVVDKKEYGGMVAVLARHGKVVYSAALGHQNIALNQPMKLDTIFYMGSQTKVVTGVAMMILYEEGKWRPEESLAKYIPEFANLKVFKEMGKDGKMVLEDAQHLPTMDELMSMQAGFSYPINAATNPIDRMYLEAGVLTAKSMQDLIDKIAKIPLLFQPGTRWVYGAEADIQGYLIEKLSGMSLADFMRTRLFEPLGMKDAYFAVPEAKHGRIAEIYRLDPKGLVATPLPKKGVSPNLASGGGGLFASTDDFLRLAQMLANGGQLNGVRVLSPASVKMLRSNRLSEELLSTGKNALARLPNGMVLPDNMTNKNAFGIAFYEFQPGLGYGYDVAVFYDPVKLGNPIGAGTISWGGAFGSWFWMDPTNDMVFIGNIQRSDLAALPFLIGTTQTLTMQALVNPEK